MSLWWMWGVGTTTVDPGTPATVHNAPSLWSGGVRWGDPAGPFNDGTDGYWSYATVPERTGVPELSVAIDGGLVLEQLQSARFGTGRSDWLSTLTPASASFDFVDVPIAHLNDTIVIGLMSDTEEYHSDSLWVGRVDNISVRRDIDGHTFSSISATDVIGILGQAKAPTSIVAGYTLKTLTERLALDAGIALVVDTDPLVTLPTLTAATDLDCSVLDLINRAERSSNALLFLRGNGHLYAAMRESTGATSVRVVTLDGDASAAGWTEDTSPQNLVTRWQLGDGDTWSTDTPATTLEQYGEHTYSASDLLIDDPAPYANLISSDVMAHPRPVVTEAPFHVRDLDDEMLFIDPLDRVVDDGTTWQVMSVAHSVDPLRLDEDGRTYTQWDVSITADATQEALAGAPEPGPVEPPAVNTVTLVYTATKAATAEKTAGGTFTGESTGPLLAGKLDGSTYRATIEWPIAWPVNTIRVVSAKVRLVTYETASDARISVRRALDSWSEGTMDWPGPHTHTDGERRFDVTSASDRVVTFSITKIAQDWRSSGENNGIRIASTNEESAARFASFYSDDAADPDNAPILTLVVEVVS